MKKLLKRIASKLPKNLQQELKRLYFSHQIKNDTFITDEKELDKLHEWLSEGDWIIDVGANIGHYTKRFSELVGAKGRVIAFEPMTDTFELLSANVAKFANDNVSLFNVAASSSPSIQGMTLPKFDTGLDNYFMAKITSSNPSFEILSISIDSLNLPHSVRLAKIDAEGHDLNVLKGMETTLRKDRPVLIIEAGSEEVESFLTNFGYISERLPGSHNKVFKPRADSSSV